MRQAVADDCRLPSYAVRPGVTFPDWAAVTSPEARKAMLAIFEAISAERIWRSYTPAEDAVRTTLLRLYAEQGRAPVIGDLARHAGVSESAIRLHLASLEARDLVVLDADGERIVGAYPWTDRETEHRVSLGERTLSALCAIDALGAGDMYGRDVEISSRCRACVAPVTIATSDRGRAVAEVQPGSAVVWSGIRETDGCAAGSICTVIAFFCEDAHLAAWRAEHHPEAPGFRLSIDEALQAGRAIFGPSLAGLEVTS
jgi:DNA-binding transcriptional ArsR family regulator